MARTYSEETRAAALAALLEGQSVSSIAGRYNIPKGTVSSWKHRYAAEVLATQATQKAHQAAAIGDLVLAYLRTSLETLQAQARQFADPAWLKAQNAADAAVLHGVMMDKAARLLELLGAPDDAADG